MEKYLELLHREWLQMDLNSTIPCEEMLTEGGHLDMDLDASGQYLAIGGTGISIYCTQTATLNTSRARTQIRSAQWYPLDAELISCIEQGRKRISWWSTHDLRSVDSMSFDLELNFQAWHPEGKLLALATERGVRLIDPVAGMAIHNLAPTKRWERLLWIDERRVAALNTGSVEVFDTRRMQSQYACEFEDPPCSLLKWHDSLLILSQNGQLAQFREERSGLLTDNLGVCPPWLETCLIPEIESMVIARSDQLLFYGLDTGQLTQVATPAVNARKVLSAQHPRSLYVLDPMGQRILHHQLKNQQG